MQPEMRKSQYLEVQGLRSITPREWEHKTSHDEYDKETANVTLQYPRRSSQLLDENDSILEQP